MTAKGMEFLLNKAIRAANDVHSYRHATLVDTLEALATLREEVADLCAAVREDLARKENQPA